MSGPWRIRSVGLALAAAVYALDQWIKHLVTGPLGLEQVGDQIYLLPIFNLTLTHNYGVSLGFLEATSPEMRWGLVALTAIIATVVLVWLLRERKFADIAPLGLILGGALDGAALLAREGDRSDRAAATRQGGPLELGGRSDRAGERHTRRF